MTAIGDVPKEKRIILVFFIVQSPLGNGDNSRFHTGNITHSVTPSVAVG